MAVVDLTGIDIASATPFPFNRPVAQHPAYGSSFIVQRLGARWQFQFSTPAMYLEPDYRRLAAKLGQAEINGGLFDIPQPRFVVGTPGSPTVDGAVASGRTVPITGATPHYAARAGQWVSLIVSGQRYADRLAEQVIIDVNGDGELELENLIRVPLAGAEVVELASPKIEGIVEITSRPPLTPSHVAAVEWIVTEVR